MLKNALISLLAAATLAACSRGSSDSLKRDQKEYDVVQEGSASGVTSTISAPGEPLAPPPGTATGTNVDTTTNFTIPQVSISGGVQPQPGSIAGTFPVSPVTTTNYPTNPPPRPRPVTPKVSEPQTTTTSPTTTEPNIEPPPATSTNPPMTDTAPPPPQEEKPTEEKPPSTDTQPPPGTTTT